MSNSLDHNSEPPRESRATPNPLWGGRFIEGASDLLTEINASVKFDFRLAHEDIAGSLAHVQMLVEQEIIPAADGDAIIQGLNQIAAELESGELELDPTLEDVHMNIESRLRQLIGPVAGRLHTGRSRNDQVAVDTKLWVRGKVEDLDRQLQALVTLLIQRALASAHEPMPGFTHLQAAQPVTVGHHLLAYAEMFFRDRDRLRAAHVRANQSPLGAAALAGTGYPINSRLTASLLGFEEPMRNSLDAVSDRDFVLDFLAASSFLAIHMSRLGEELVLWSTPQFGYVTVPENLSAGSSIMPQKRNPDVAELIRAKSGRVIGSLVGLLIVLKGLPLAYSRDLQEDKEGLFDAADTVDICVRSVTALLEGLTFNFARLREDALRGNTLATDLADWLVSEQDLPFRDAHQVVGSVVKRLEDRRAELQDVPVSELRAMSEHLSDLPDEILTVDRAISRRTSYGGTSPMRLHHAASQLASLNSSTPLLGS